MRVSKSFFRTEKSAPKDILAESYGLLYRGGFIRPIAAGRYVLLPLGMRVQKNIIKIIEEELRTLGAQHVEFPPLCPMDTWALANQEKNQNDLPEIAKDSRAHDAVLNEGGESLALKLLGSLSPSYKDLPIHFYRFLPQFEAKPGLKDEIIQPGESMRNESYFFETDEPSLLKTLSDCSRAYDRIFRSMGLETVPLILDRDSPGKNPSWHFILITPETSEKLDIYWNENEEIENMEFIDCSMDSKLYRRIRKFYSQHPEKTLKNELFRVDEREYVCIVIRGDYRIDINKVKKLLNCTLIRPLTSNEIERLDSCPGYVSAMGLIQKVKVLIDESVRYNKNYWDGGNKEGIFKKNVNFDRDFGAKETVDAREDKIYAAGSEKIVVCDHCDYRANIDEAEFISEKINMDEEIKEFMMVDQPEWVCTMEDNVAHYKKPKSHFLKNVAYKDKSGRLIIAVVRGDLEADPAKISKVLDCGELELANDEDFDRIHTQAGWIHSWGHDQDRDDVIYICDKALKVSRNLIGGFKEKSRDAFNVNYGRDFKCANEGDIVRAQNGMKCKNCRDGHLWVKKGAELGCLKKHHPSYFTFHDAFFIDRSGKEESMLMGAGKIEVGKLIACVVEVQHDNNGILWPKSLAPYLISLVTIGHSPKIMEESEKIYIVLQKHGWEVLWDDRETVSAGVKLMDADLIGNPIRILVSDRSLKSNCLELKRRSQGEAEFVEINEYSIVDAVKRNEKSLEENELAWATASSGFPVLI